MINSRRITDKSVSGKAPGPSLSPPFRRDVSTPTKVVGGGLPTRAGQRATRYSVRQTRRKRWQIVEESTGRLLDVFDDYSEATQVAREWTEGKGPKKRAKPRKVSATRAAKAAGDRRALPESVTRSLGYVSGDATYAELIQRRVRPSRMAKKAATSTPMRQCASCKKMMPASQFPTSRARNCSACHFKRRSIRSVSSGGLPSLGRRR